MSFMGELNRSRLIFFFFFLLFYAFNKCKIILGYSMMSLLRCANVQIRF